MTEPRRRPVTAIGWVSVALAALLWAAAFTADGLIHSRYTNVPGYIGTTILYGGMGWDRRVQKRRAAAQRPDRPVEAAPKVPSSLGEPLDGQTGE